MRCESCPEADSVPGPVSGLEREECASRADDALALANDAPLSALGGDARSSTICLCLLLPMLSCLIACVAC